jgi:hypothetical protein
MHITIFIVSFQRPCTQKNIEVCRNCSNFQFGLMRNERRLYFLGLLRDGFLCFYYKSWGWNLASDFSCNGRCTEEIACMCEISPSLLFSLHCLPHNTPLLFSIPLLIIQHAVHIKVTCSNWNDSKLVDCISIKFHVMKNSCIWKHNTE